MVCMIATPGFLDQLSEALTNRRIADGIHILDGNRSGWEVPRGTVGSGAATVLHLAQWIDVGYRDYRTLAQLIEQFPAADRASMPVREYLLLRMAEAFYSIAREDADTAIDVLDFVLKAESELGDAKLVALAHFWIGRAHRKKGEYEPALRHITEAKTRAEASGAVKLVAVIEIQQGWLLFQNGEPKEALRLLRHAEGELKTTDDAVSLGNIESARGRIVRRAGEYAEALEHYRRAIAIYGQRDDRHRNLARALVNAAYVKRLIALQLRKRLDARVNGQGGRTRGAQDATRGLHERYTQICREALEELDRAGTIYHLHEHHGGIGSVLVNTGHLHLEMGAADQAIVEGEKAYALARSKHDHILMARARILEASAENVRVNEQLGEDVDIAAYANAARRWSEQAIALAKQTQNRRLLAGAYIARGTTAANDFFQEWEAARQYVTRASALLRSDDRDHLWEELLSLKSRILRASGTDELLRAWSEGMVGEKTFQQVSEEFAEIVIPKVWAREGKKVSRVAEKLSVSPKKVRRILRNAGLLDQNE